MTINVCHKSFNKSIHLIGKGISTSIKIGTMTLIPIGLFLTFFVVDWNMPLGTDSDVFRQNLDYTLLTVFILVFGIGGTPLVLFVIPWIDDEDNIIIRINKKLGLFKWREDC